MPAPESQPVASDLSRAAIFMVAILAEGDGATAAVRGLSGKLGALVRSVGFRDLPVFSQQIGQFRHETCLETV